MTNQEIQNRYQSYLKAFSSNCTQCFKGRSKPCNIATPVGDVTSELLIFGETPSNTDLINGTAFSGDQKGILDAIAQTLGYDSYFATNFVACRPSKVPIYAEYVENCMLAHVAPYIRRVAPNIHSVVLLGRNAFNIAEKYIMAPTVTEYAPGKRVGILLHNKHVDVYSLYHPSSLIFGKVTIEEYKKQIADVRELIDRRRRLHG